MKTTKKIIVIFAMSALAAICGFAQTSDRPTKNPNFDAALAKKVGADQYGMRQYVLVILKSGPKQMAEGRERDAIFAGHLANINRLADENRLAVAGPFMKNDRDFRGLFIINVKTVEEAKALVDTDPAIKAGILLGEFVPWYGTAALLETTRIHKTIAKENP